jgi:formamidopyrimidine-DNA glycosylase
MPELPEVETVRRGLQPALEGARFEHVLARRLDLRWPLPKDFVHRLEGNTVTGLGRRAKYLLADLSSGEVLLMHLGMSGSFRVFHDGHKNKPGRFHHEKTEHLAHDHIVFEMSSGATVTFNDPRRFGFMKLVPRTKLEHEPSLGNIYVCEALHRALLSPKRKASTIAAARTGLPNDRSTNLVDAIRAVLNDAIKAGGSSLRDHRQTDGELGYFQNHFRVYDREGEPCVTPGCSGTVRRIVQSGRSTFFCPVCQK